MPVVSKEIIESLVSQTVRTNNSDSLNEYYFIQKFEEMKSENEFLANSINKTLASYIKTFELDTADNRDSFLLINIFNLAIMVYQSIKQQMICDELEDKVEYHE